uniref:Prephenate dehydrogenase nucleotide-binding domain-containing protein n=1 Tax=uncultured prokaryote TaxID=198431 RepID=A0A0H5QJ71_9ZZZZ|nr:hypothetical protein [uncultured prokaryote]
MKIGIVGLGLIGGSMAKSVKNRTSHTVYGIDLDQETMMLSRMCGAIDGPLNDETLPQCDLVLAAIRPQAAVDWVEEHAARIAKSAILVDLCGVKRVVVERLAPIAAEYGFAYIGGQRGQLRSVAPGQLDHLQPGGGHPLGRPSAGAGDGGRPGGGAAGVSPCFGAGGGGAARPGRRRGAAAAGNSSGGPGACMELTKQTESVTRGTLHL